MSSLADVCAASAASAAAGSQPWSSVASPDSELPPLSCADYADRKPGWQAVRLVMGVATGPGNRKRRDAIRQTWMRWPSVGRSVIVCFAVGRRQVPKPLLAQLDAEAAAHRDVLFLPVSDGCVSMVSIGKAHAFWSVASRLVRGAKVPPFIGKADDDSFVNVPLLERMLSRLHCAPRLYLGAIAFVGFHPLHLRNCGFAWAGGRAWEKYGCASTGAHPPFPFALGQLQVMAASLATSLAQSVEARALATSAEAQPNNNANEDAAIGFMLNRLGNVTYVSLGKNAWHNLGCFPTSGMYRPPGANSSVVVHRLLTIAALRYAWSVMHDGEKPNVVRCQNAVMKWGEGPVERLRGWCNLCTSDTSWKLRAGAPRGCAELGGSRSYLARLREACAELGFITQASTGTRARRRHEQRTNSSF